MPSVGFGEEDKAGQGVWDKKADDVDLRFQMAHHLLGKDETEVAVSKLGDLRDSSVSPGIKSLSYRREYSSPSSFFLAFAVPSSGQAGESSTSLIQVLINSSRANAPVPGCPEMALPSTLAQSW